MQYIDLESINLSLYIYNYIYIYLYIYKPSLKHLHSNDKREFGEEIKKNEYHKH